MIRRESALPVVSILIPVFNRERFIGDCIQSALDQTFKDIEIIVVDNVSTDGTWLICQEYAARDLRIRTFRNETNIGPVKNWLRCVKEARGEYSKILFSDDLMAPEFIARTLPLIRDSTIAFAYTSAYIGETIETGVVCYSNGPKTLYSIDEYLALLIFKKVPYRPGAALFRTEDIRKNLHDSLPTCSQHEFWRHGAGPDVLLYALTAVEYITIAAVDEPLVLFRAHSGSISICNNNNEISEGYRAALSWFFAKRDTRSLWYDYLAIQWFEYSQKPRSWASIGKFVKKYEGTGSLQEQMRFMVEALFLLFSRAWRKLLKLGFGKL
jgi:glycosyltransferase involved in cell wall biosynthesis